MACCLTAPSHYLNQCCLINCRDLCHSPKGNNTGNAYESNHYDAFENDIFKIKAVSARAQGVNRASLSVVQFLAIKFELELKNVIEIGPVLS